MPKVGLFPDHWGKLRSLPVGILGIFPIFPVNFGKFPVQKFPMGTWANPSPVAKRCRIEVLGAANGQAKVELKLAPDRL